jgi:hypothetical protein
LPHNADFWQAAKEKIGEIRVKMRRLTFFGALV